MDCSITFLWGEKYPMDSILFTMTMGWKTPHGQHLVYDLNSQNNIRLKGVLLSVLALLMKTLCLVREKSFVPHLCSRNRDNNMYSAQGCLSLTLEFAIEMKLWIAPSLSMGWKTPHGRTPPRSSTEGIHSNVSRVFDPHP